MADTSSGTDPQLVAVAAELLSRVDELADQLCDRIRSELPFYADEVTISAAALRASCRANLELGLLPLVGGDAFDTSQARATGARRAADGAPLPTLMEAYRVGTRFIWELLVAEARRGKRVTSDALVRAASDIWTVQDRSTQAMAAAYREVLTARVVVQEHERSALVEALLEGRITDTTTLWEAADILRIPASGLHVVVAAEPPQLGREALPGIEVALRLEGITSAWRLLPSLQVGIACLGVPKQVGPLVEALGRCASGRVGVSPPYESLGLTVEALRLARIAVNGSAAERPKIVVFDESPLAVTAVASPDVMRRVAGTVFAGLAELEAADRALLLETLAAWLDSGGSAEVSARRLYCHPNTVRNRLRRLEELTSRSLADPRQLTEICVALEAEQRLPPHQV
jgi:PucR C-terminal helix-turn-helix domain/GGDEF-like domain